MNEDDLWLIAFLDDLELDMDDYLFDQDDWDDVYDPIFYDFEYDYDLDMGDDR